MKNPFHIKFNVSYPLLPQTAFMVKLASLFHYVSKKKLVFIGVHVEENTDATLSKISSHFFSLIVILSEYLPDLQGDSDEGAAEYTLEGETLTGDAVKKQSSKVHAYA